MRIAIVGCGYVGKELARRRVEEGDEVYGVTRSGVDIEGVESLERDVSESYELPDADRVFYLVGSDSRDEEGYREAYVEGVRNTLEATDDETPLVYSSSTGVYDATDGSWVDEETDLRTDEATGRRKILIEAEREVLGADRGTTVVRFAGLYGEGRFWADKYLGDSEVKSGYTNLLRREDAATALFAAHEGPDDVYLAVDDEPVHRHDLARWIADRTGRDHGELVDEPSRTNKRCSNDRLRSTGWEPEYPTYREGLQSLLEQ